MNKYNNSAIHEGKVVSVNISEKKGTVKIPVQEIFLTEKGVQNDAHTSIGDVQVSMLRYETINLFSVKHNKILKPGDFAENITIEGFDQISVNLLDHFIIDETEMEVTRIGKKCNGKECSIYQTTGDCIMPREGIFLRVIKQGAIQPGNIVKHIPRVFNFKVITLSNRAYAGEYHDTSGYEIQRILKEHFGGINRQIYIDYRLIPDNAEWLKQEIEETVKMGYDVILTTGGTGVGPGDITYDVVSSLCDKIIPGIMEFIRMKYGQTNSHALLSRSIAGIIKDILIYTLPGSQKAVKEYMDELLRTMEHLIYVMNGLSH
ncbi:MAG: molybdenum cofactor synthesis protein [Clostridia bacterium]|jgi:molybdenum cofactor synthesis domain-containing protein|uniref:molybdenum cofactor synthesis domain-containing protein n=1 Tax=Petroclostridium xylanilyticum TaxID=1792311 RepID=UPI000B99027C|nr:molybdenum cofactor synthesis domain-containing protein [Petroclostridium xylanilyticum]MBZ4646020.1 molybdenum cofactor synthesis protein [Clostridia bacterium]